MKTRSIFKTIGILTVVFIFSGSLMAQRGQREMRGMHPQTNARIAHNLELTEEQKAEFSKLNSDHLEKMKQHQSLLNEKKAHLKTLMTVSEKDKKAIETTIDEITGLQGKIMKMNFAHGEAMKALLTPEQLEKAKALRAHTMRPGQRFDMKGNRQIYRGQRGNMRTHQQGFRGQREQMRKHQQRFREVPAKRFQQEEFHGKG